MLTLLIKRLVQLFPILIGVAALTFFISRSIPGDPFANEKPASEQIQQKLKKYYGFDKPIYQQFFIWFSKAIRGDFGPSFKHKSYTVNDLIKESFPASLELGFWSLLFAIIVGIPIGAFAAVKKNKFFDHFALSGALIGICLPAFVLAPILIYIFSIWLRIFNPIGWENPGDRVLPTITLGLYFAAYIARLTRAGFLEILNQDFIRTAVAKGLSWNKIIWKHAFKGSITPVVAYLGPAAAHLITGSFVIETIFFIPGLGKHFIESAFNRDFGMLLGVTILYAFLLAVFNIIVDIIIIYINPTAR